MIYFVQCGDAAGPVKIGFSADEAGVRQRLSTLQIGCPYDLVLRQVVTGSQSDEAAIHLVFGPNRVRGEWFACTDHLDVALRSESLARSFVQDCVDCVRGPELKELLVAHRGAVAACPA